MIWPSRRIAGLLPPLALIAWATLTPAPFSHRAHTLRIAFDLSPEHLREDLLNACLFAPLGVACHVIGWNRLRTVAFAAAISLAVELLQLVVITGRFAELQDVVANTAGAAVAWWIWQYVRPR